MILKFGDSGPEVVKLQTKLKEQGYFKGKVAGNFGKITLAAVKWFQSTHIGPDGKYLVPDGIVGPKTWWALDNPSGPKQRNNITPLIPSGIFGNRLKFLEVVVKEWKDGVHEEPDGSNWGDGIIKYGGQKGWAWCCLFISWCYKQAVGKYPFGRLEPSTYSAYQYSLKNRIFYPKGKYAPIPGDFMLIQHPGTYTGHISAVLRVSKDKKEFNTIGGNEGNRVKCGIRTINQKDLVGFINPYSGEEKIITNYETGTLKGEDLSNISDR